jgi:hypothetical protein
MNARRGRPVLKRPTTDDHIKAPTGGIAQALLEPSSAENVDIEIDDASEDVETAAPDPVTYRWSIPHTGADGYALVVQVNVGAVGYHDIKGAREIALHTPGIGRDLTPVESNWIATTEPEIVRPTTAVTLNYDHALFLNRQLVTENKSFDTAKAAFEQLGIDVNDPLAWVNTMIDEAQERIDSADLSRRQKMITLWSRLDGLQSTLNEVIDSDPEFSPPKPAAPREPSYAGLIAHVAGASASEARSRFPRLADATFLDVPIMEPLTTEEREGFAILFERNGGIVEDWRMRHAGASEHEPVRAIMRRFQAILKVSAPVPVPVVERAQVQLPPGGTGIPPARKPTG